MHNSIKNSHHSSYIMTLFFFFLQLFCLLGENYLFSVKWTINALFTLKAEKKLMSCLGKMIIAIGVSYCTISKEYVMNAKLYTCWVIAWASIAVEHPLTGLVSRHLSPSSHKWSQVTLLVLIFYKGQVFSHYTQLLRWKLIFLFISLENK